ncbi:MAG: autotransporter outer membrane beta-barrel domain-containing protein, partial [Planctomycetota bacterium]|nr:autotransporter outer membrane beta-barrel domain-containing protein [Planctomycetota bacterium]
LDGEIVISNGGIVTSGDAAGDVTSIGGGGSIFLQGDGIAGNTLFTAVGELQVDGTLSVTDGAHFVHQGLGDGIDLSDATLAGGTTEGYDPLGPAPEFFFDDFLVGVGNLEVGTIISGVFDEQTGTYGANYGTLTLNLQAGINLDLSQSELIFYVSDQDASGGGNTGPFIVIGNAGSNIEFGAGTQIEVAIGAGDGYIPTGTTFTLFDENQIENGWDEVSFSGFNTVTRSFSYDAAGGDPAGTVAITADYSTPAQGGGSVVAQRGSWLQGESASIANGGQGPASLLQRLDQIETVSQYQAALARLGPEGTASALQVLSDTNAFNAYHEALSDMRTGNQLGRPGPARRPLSRSSQSLLATQDEADAVRSQYGYGAGAESGRRRQQEDDMVAFVQGYGRTINLDNMRNVIGVDGNQGGVLVGVGGQVSDNSVLGLLVGYDDFNGTLNDDYGSVDVGTVRVGPFFGWANEDWNVDLALTGGYNDWNGTRKNVALKTKYPWSTGGWQLDFSAGAGYRIPLGGGLNLVPEASFVYSFIQTDSYTEGGNQAGRLNVDTNDLNAIIGRAGASLEVVSITGLLIEGRLGWQGNYSFGGDLETGVLGGGAPLPGTPDQVDRNNLYYGTQLTWMPSWDVGISFRYEGRTLDGTNDQYFGGGVSFEF